MKNEMKPPRLTRRGGVKRGQSEGGRPYRLGPPGVLRTEVRKPAPLSARLHPDRRDGRDGERLPGQGLKFPLRYRILARLLLGYRAPRRPIFGMVLAGEIESVGRNVRNLQPGD